TRFSRDWSSDVCSSDLEVRKQAQEARGRLSSLETLQHAALGQEQGAAVEWLRQRGLDSAARVGERLVVEPGWENAVEGALGQLRSEERRVGRECRSGWL